MFLFTKKSYKDTIYLERKNKMISAISLENLRIQEIRLLNEKSKQSGIPICVLELVSDLMGRKKANRPTNLTLKQPEPIHIRDFL